MNVRSTRFRMSQAQIPIGAKLTFIRDDKVIATVLDDAAIEFEGQRMTVSKAALIVMRRLGYGWQSIQGGLYWTYEGETLLARKSRLPTSS